jgi:transposase
MKTAAHPQTAYIEGLRAENKALKEKLALLEEQLTWLKRQVFGQRSERFVEQPADSNQCQLELATGASQPPVVQVERISYERRKQAGAAPHGREEIPAHLPREEKVLQPDVDTQGMQRIGEKVTEELEYVAPRFFVKRTVRPVYVEVVNGQRIMHCAELPARCVEKGKFGSSLVGHLITSKCIDHLPLYRICEQLKRECGLELPRSTIEGAFGRGCFWLEWIAAELRRRLGQAAYRQMDESTIRVLIEGLKGKSHQGYMWVQLAPLERIVTFDYRTSRSGRWIQELIGPHWQGVLHSDGYEEYRRFVAQRSGIVHANCWAHGRRGFDKALDNDRERATFALQKVRQLFDIEQDAPDMGQGRRQLRQEHSRPIVDELFTWLRQQVEHITPKSTIGKAVLYMLDRQKELRVFLEDGRVELSTNLIENKIRPLALGRKNYLFAGSENGARNLAAAYSVIGTCVLNNVNPSHYVTDVLARLPSRRADDTDDLLPTNWKPALAA